MPRTIDFGAPFGTREFPDSATDDDIIAEYDRVKAASTPAPSPEDYLQQASRSFITGATRELASLPKAAGIIGSEIRRVTGGTLPGAEIITPEETLPYQLGQQIEKAGEAISPAEVPALRESFLATQVPSGVGSGVGFLLGGSGTKLLTRGLRTAAGRAAERELAEAAAEKGASLGTRALASVAEGAEIGTLGAVSQFQQAYEDALAHGADRDVALKAGLLNLPIGATEAIPLGNMLRRLDRFEGGGFTKYLIAAGKETFEEALQEAAQNFMSNAVEKNLYNPAKNLLDDVAEQGAAGGVSGFLLSSLTHALGAGARRLRKGTTQEQRGTEIPPGGPSEVSTTPQQQGASGNETRVTPAAVAPTGEEAPSLIPSAITQPQSTTTYAKETEAQAQARGGETPQLVGQAEGGLRLRNPPQNRVEAGTTQTQTPAAQQQVLNEVLLEPQQEAEKNPKRMPFDLVTSTDEAGRTLIDRARLEESVRSGQISASEASTALLLHLLRENPNHPISEIELITDRPANEVGYQGRFTTQVGSPIGRVQIVSQKATGVPLSQGNFVRSLNHELLHNAVTSKWGSAPFETRQEATRLYEWVKEKSAGTEWVGRNALKNVDEFLAEALSQKSFRDYLAKLDYSEAVPRTERGHATVQPSYLRSVLGRLLDIVRRLLGIPDRIETPDGRQVETIMALDHAIDISSRLESVKRRPSFGPPIVSNLPATPPIESMRVAGAGAQVGRASEEAYGKREQAGRLLEGLAYERQQFKAARAELRRLSQIVEGRLLGEGFNAADSPEVFPDPMEGVEIKDAQVVVGPEFDTKLNAMGIPFNPNLHDMQGEVFFEREAHRLKNIQAQIDMLNSVMTYYTQPGLPQKDTDKFQKRLNALTAEATKLGEAQWNGKTIGARTAEITQAEAEKTGLMGKRKALSLPPVMEFFGRQVGGYRDFLAKTQQAAALAEALKNETTDPAEIARLTAEASSWLALPAEVRDAVMSGSPLTEEQKSSAFAALGSAFEDFDIQRALMSEMKSSETEKIDKEARALLQKITTAKIDEGMAEVLVADVLATLDGESGATGTLQSQAAAQELKNRISSIKTFALNLGQNLETNGTLFDWLSNPVGLPPLVLNQAGQAFGVDGGTLNLILSEVKKNPAFGSAIVTLVSSADKKLANLPIVQLEEIEKLLQEGKPEAAEAAAQKMLNSAKARASLMASSQRENLRKLEQLDVERNALNEGEAMFNEVAASKDYQDIRNVISSSPYGLLQPMDVQNNVSHTYVAFGGEGLPSHPALVLTASDDPTHKAEDFQKIHEWAEKAQEHLDAYDKALTDYRADPANNPSPDALGFDVPIIRGLRDAVNRSVPGSAQELSVQTPESRFKVPALMRAMNKLAWFRQHNFVASMIGGEVGTALRTALGNWINGFRITQAISHQHRDIPELRHKAMRSHPEVKMNFEMYRRMVWNELGHWGRMFGSPVRAGFRLPESGLIVTPEDVALLKRSTQEAEELRRKVAERHPVGGVRVTKGSRELVRPGAYVGDKATSMPRYLNRNADQFITGVLDAYTTIGSNGQPVAINFDPASDLSITSSDKTVKFWNEHSKDLAQHVRDSDPGRTDRSMKQTPLMQQAERTAWADWQANGQPPINSVEDVVNELVKHFPPAPGLNVREQVINGLAEELKQYRDEANRIETERKQQADARNTGATINFTADNEFTRPAAQLALPSRYYDYGALTDVDHILKQARANHEAVVGYANTIRRAINTLRQSVIQARDNPAMEKKLLHGADIEEAKQMIGLLEQIASDFNAAYQAGLPASKGGFWQRISSLLTSALLALPTVNLRNMTQGQFAVYAMSRAMGLAGERMLMQHALLNMPRTLIRYALHVGGGIAKRGDLGQAFLTGKNWHLAEGLVDKIAKLLLQPDYKTSADRVKELGYDTRDAFLQRMRRIWQATAETAEDEDLKNARIGGRGVRKLAAVPAQMLKAIFDKIGVQESDLVINSSVLNIATDLEKRLQQVAIDYGTEREKQGLTKFDSTDRRWDLYPDEWASLPGGQQANKDALGIFRLFLERTASPEGFQLEKNLWDYYQKYKAGQRPRFFTDAQFDAVQAGLLAEFNASNPANRPSAAAASPTIRSLLSLQGYSSDLLSKITNSHFGGTRDRKLIAMLGSKLPMVLTSAVMTTLIGYVVAALIGQWEKRTANKNSSLPQPYDADFWTGGFKRWGEGTTRMALAQIPYLGDIMLALRNEIQGNRGFDPVGRIVPISLIQRALNTLRGMWTAKGSVGDRLQPAWDTGRSMIPWFSQVEKAFGGSVNWVKQGQRLTMGRGQEEDLLPEGRGVIVGGPTYGPTTIIRRNITEAVSKLWDAQQAGDTAGAAQALSDAQGELKKLQEFYTAKYVKAGKTPEEAAAKAQQDVWRDYQELNPVVAGLLGKRPTQAEYELIRKGLSGDRLQAFNNGIAAWQGGAQALFGRAAPITREEVGAGRGGGLGVGGGAIAGIPSGLPSASRISGGVRQRRLGIRPPALRRPAGIGTPPRLSTPRVGLRAPRVRRGPSLVRSPRPRIRRLRPTVTAVNRRRRLGRTPRSRYAAA